MEKHVRMQSRSSNRKASQDDLVRDPESSGSSEDGTSFYRNTAEDHD